MRPACFDRPEFVGYWMPVRQKIGDRKPRWRWVEQRMSQRCAAWDAPDIRDSVPARERWDCRGCRWLPKMAEQFAMAGAGLRRALERAVADIKAGIEPTLLDRFDP